MEVCHLALQMCPAKSKLIQPNLLFLIKLWIWVDQGSGLSCELIEPRPLTYLTQRALVITQLLAWAKKTNKFDLDLN